MKELPDIEGYLEERVKVRLHARFLNGHFVASALIASVLCAGTMKLAAHSVDYAVLAHSRENR